MLVAGEAEATVCVAWANRPAKLYSKGEGGGQEEKRLPTEEFRRLFGELRLLFFLVQKEDQN
jgi:hypothetical protein